MYKNISKKNRNKQFTQTDSPCTRKDKEGLRLWHSIGTIVIFRQVMRQHRTSNKAFIELLGRLHHGTCNLEDFQTLSTRLTTNVDPDWNLWRNTPVIVNDNLTKDMINERSAINYAKTMGKPLHWYYATDAKQGQIIKDADLQTHLLNLSSRQTNYIRKRYTTSMFE